MEGLTEWLAEIARSALDTVLVLDEADRLPPESFEALAYVLRNLPPNLRALVGMRGEMLAGLDDLVDYGQCATVGPSDLRFDVDETIELVRQRFGADFDPAIAVRLHEMADGWPLGIQLVLAVMAADRDPRAAAETLLRQKGPLHHRFVALLLANLDPSDLALPDARLDPRRLQSRPRRAPSPGCRTRRSACGASPPPRRCSSPANRATGCGCMRSPGTR